MSCVGELFITIFCWHLDFLWLWKTIHVDFCFVIFCFCILTNIWCKYFWIIKSQKITEPVAVSKLSLLFSFAPWVQICMIIISNIAMLSSILLLSVLFLKRRCYHKLYGGNSQILSCFYDTRVSAHLNFIHWSSSVVENFGATYNFNFGSCTTSDVWSMSELNFPATKNVFHCF